MRWDFTAPYFQDRFRVFAMDLSGMGDSGHRPVYTPTTHIDDIRTVIQHIGGRPPVLVAHSYGGSSVLRLCAASPEVVSRSIVLDSYVSFPEYESPTGLRKRGRVIPYPDFESARAHFRLMPAQFAEDYALEHVAFHSLKSVPGGWTWKFDPKLAEKFPEFPGADVLARIDVAVDVVVGGQSRVVDARRADRIVASLPHGRGPITVSEAGHHLMLDQPLSTIAAIRALLVC